MSQQLWDTSGIYHSHLVYYQNEHPEGLVCQILVAAMDSQHKQGERIARIRPHGYPEVDGKAGGHWLKLEDGSSVEEDLGTAPLKTWILLTAQGRGEAATVQWREHDVGDDGNGITTAPIVTTPKPVSVPVAAEIATETSGEPFLNSLLQAYNIVEKYKEITGTELTENVRTLATNIRGSMK